jgi:L,D-transpeptidase YcbB
MKDFINLLLVMMLLLPCGVIAQNPIADAIKKNGKKLHYPHSVERFYQQEGFNAVWVLKDTIKTPVWDAMLLLDVVAQYGLNPNDYYLSQLTYNKLHFVQSEKANNNDKAGFDILLTDAVIALINNLHYGKLNPEFSPKRIDAENISEFKGDKILIEALGQKSLMTSILKVQPHSEAYNNLQRHMKLLTTKYSGVNYTKPERDIRKMAINMERLRWINTTGKEVHLTCVVKQGVIVYYKDIDKQDKILGKLLLENDKF